MYFAFMPLSTTCIFQENVVRVLDSSHASEGVLFIWIFGVAM